jgi:hypothetical protein
MVIIPPETIQTSQWALFDSHSRPQLSIDGSYLLTAPSSDAILNHLRILFPALTDGGVLGDEESIWTMMYNSIEANVFVRKE